MKVSQVTESFNLDNVVPFFQPIMDLSNNQVWRYECLARLITFGERPFIPSEFLYLVDRQESQSQLTETIFNRSAQYFRERDIPWNINVSLADMQDESIHRFLSDQVQNYPNPRRVALEVTAQNVLADTETFDVFSHLCKKLRLSLFVDNVELEQDSIERLLALPISALKMSGPMLASLAQDRLAQSIVKTLSEQGERKNIALVAQHLESEEQLALLKQLNVRYAQGFFFSQPKAQAH
ncbi:EAL domain-containing protein [Paraglaciecola polaris]|uniref:Diguanylate phosphodiesterase n=1 Tax=Paraglaciecola polaris LMG 21857 TaxID=1129793 RepID=K6ZQ79_9ALTE|nr:EAL domain-containing protein [Paraglaciecola polaris]GAC32437.1 diguanylate phosphodiesterase [Paraglaciecola polaris LMG 21857]|tara:strand:- start:5342 stop:6055 length:714 start_codon:yes stop_codon:yes gene_type:complete